jgi:hypothetical protein
MKRSNMGELTLNLVLQDNYKKGKCNIEKEIRNKK